MTTREQAILICDCAASTPPDPFLPVAYRHVARCLDVKSEKAILLACEAWNALWSSEGGDPWDRAMDAEAAQRLREGWTP